MSHRRSGFSVVELLVVLGLVGTVLGSFWLAAAGGYFQSTELDFRAAALQSAQLLVARIDADLQSFAPGALGDTFAEPMPRPGIRFDRVTDRPGLPLDERGSPVTERVTYRFDAATRQVVRNDEPLPHGPFENVAFTFFPARPGDPTSPHGFVLVVEIEIVPADASGRADATTARAQFRMTLRSPQGTANHAASRWVGDR
jgi:hypothetical protein